MKHNIRTKEEFDVLFEKWKEAIQPPHVRASSRVQDYIDNKPYHDIVRLGEDGLPFIIKKLEQGVFFLNQAFLDVVGLRMEDIIGKDIRFPSEQEKSAAIVRWWKSHEAFVFQPYDLTKRVDKGASPGYQDIISTLWKQKPYFEGLFAFHKEPYQWAS